MRLILASSSSSRQKILNEAGVDFVSIPSGVDETPVHLDQHLSPREKAKKLSWEKALSVSRLYLDDMVIGADQVLDINGKIMTKSHNIKQAREQLEQLRGKTHALPTALSMVKNCSVVWDYMEIPRLTMRNFSDSFLEKYLKYMEKDHITVGCYRIEDMGIQLFENINGDHYSIMGLPLLPLIIELRRWNIL